MAGDWIKMRGNLWDDPRVGALVDATDSTEATVIGGLYWLWATADQHTEDGVMPGLSLRQIDRKTGVRGLGAALVEIGWLAEEGASVRIIKFEDHNGTSAKKRAVTAKRVASHRSGNADVTQPALHEGGECDTRALAREREEIEEEKSGEPIPSDPIGSGADAPPEAVAKVRQGASLRDQVYAIGVTLLTAADVADKHARSFLAAQCKAHGEARVLEALHACAAEQAIQPVPWIVAFLGAGATKARSPPEPEWRKEQRERTQLAAPGVASGGQQAAEFFDVEARTVQAIRGPK